MKMWSSVVTDHYPSLRTLCLEKAKITDTHFHPIDELLSKWESNLVDSAVGCQSYWDVRATGLWCKSGQSSCPSAMGSQYSPPSVRCFEISWYRELWESSLLRFIHYLAKSEDLIEANRSIVFSKSFQKLWLSQNYAVKMLHRFTNGERQTHHF